MTDARTREGRNYYRDRGPPDREPDSLTEARFEEAEVVAIIAAIDADLGHANRQGVVDPQWRRRAVDAKRHAIARRRWLKAWVHEQVQRERAAASVTSNQHRAADLATVTTTRMAKVVAFRVARLEAVYAASVRYRADPSPARAAAWNQAVLLAVDEIGEPRWGPPALTDGADLTADLTSPMLDDDPR